MKSSLFLAAGMLVWLASAAIGQSSLSPGAQPLRQPEIVMQNGVATLPASLTIQRGDPGAGKKVITDRRLGNCLSCHQIGSLRDEPFHGEIGPPLDGVGERWGPATLRMIVVNPKKVFGQETAMPAFYQVDGLNRVRPEFAGKPILSAQQIEDVVIYLSMMK